MENFKFGDLVLNINKKDPYFGRVGSFDSTSDYSCKCAVIIFGKERIVCNKSSLLKINNKLKNFV